MILDVASSRVRPGRSSACAPAFREAQAIIATVPGYRSQDLQRCLEREGLLCWDGIAAQVEGFGNSAQVPRWRKLLHHCHDPPPSILHHEHSARLPDEARPKRAVAASDKRYRDRAADG